MNNIPQVKLGIIAVSRDCFVISLSERRRADIVKAYGAKGGEIVEIKKTVENERICWKPLLRPRLLNVMHWWFSWATLVPRPPRP